jgi:large subunit ribosomal protein L25
MAKQAELAVSPRDVTGKATKRLRQAGVIPANIFGRGEASQAVQIVAHDFEELRRAHKATSVVSLKIAGTKKAQTALIRHVQRNPTDGKILHINFFRVSLRDRIAAKVPLHFVGTPPGVKVENGVLLHLLEALEVECAAGEIVEALEVDVSGMEHIDDILHAKDVKLPEHYTLVTDPEEPVVKVTPPRVEKVEEVAAVPAEAAAEAPAAEAPAEGTEA